MIKKVITYLDKLRKENLKVASECNGEIKQKWRNKGQGARYKFVY